MLFGGGFLLMYGMTVFIADGLSCSVSCRRAEFLFRIRARCAFVEQTVDGLRKGVQPTGSSVQAC